MTNDQQSRLAEQLDAALATLAPATVARLAHSDRSQRGSAITIMAQALASRLNDDRQRAGSSEAAMLPLDLQ